MTTNPLLVTIIDMPGTRATADSKDANRSRSLAEERGKRMTDMMEALRAESQTRMAALRAKLAADAERALQLSEERAHQPKTNTTPAVAPRFARYSTHGCCSFWTRDQGCPLHGDNS